MTKEEIIKNNDELSKKIKDVCKELYPNFDSIQIFATKHDGNEYGTTQISWGLGNFYARYGQIVQWIKTEDLYIKEEDNED